MIEILRGETILFHIPKLDPAPLSFHNAIILLMIQTNEAHFTCSLCIALEICARGSKLAILGDGWEMNFQRCLVVCCLCVCIFVCDFDGRDFRGKRDKERDMEETWGDRLERA